MTLEPGATLGYYEVVAPLGAGGMGEVYRGIDTRLRREVAIKVLPGHLASDPERVLRLTREARLLAAVSHPNIGAIHGVEELDGSIALILELVEGPTLAERLATGPLPVKSAVTIALQVAQALEAAHARGIVHRDLKPANVKLAPDSRVKVLDFGLAKAVAPDKIDEHTVAAPSSASTLSGVVVGTPAYMSPEQATGGAVDRRTDIWAFGCLLFEMLSGRRAFDGGKVADTLVRVLEHDPDWHRLPRDVPQPLVRVLERCLRKEASQRFQDIGDARIELEDLVANHGAVRTISHPSLVDWKRRAHVASVAAVLAVLAGATATAVVLKRAAVPSPLRAEVSLPPGVVLPMETGHPVLALSPDGETLVFVGADSGVTRLYRRALAEADARPIAGTEGATGPFFSPDGASVGYFDGPRLKRVELAGGLPGIVTGVTPSSVSRGAAWLTPDTLVVALSKNSGLSVQRISQGAVGAIADWVPITEDTASYAWPSAVRGTRYVVFADNAGGAPDGARMSLLDRRTRTVRPLLTGGTHPFVPSKDLLTFVRDGGLYAADLNLSSAQIGPERKLLDGIMTEADGAAHVAFSTSGTLAWVAGSSVSGGRELVSVDRSGAATPLPIEGHAWEWPRLSPDGRKLAVAATLGANEDLFVLALDRMGLDRVTTDPGEDFGAVWSPDGARIAFSSETFSAVGGPLAVVRAFAGGRPEMIVQSAGRGSRRGDDWSHPTSWSPDGNWIAATTVSNGNADVQVAPADGSGMWKPVAASPTVKESAGAFSSDGRFIAYVSDESGEEEVFVQPFPSAGARVRISTNGGTEPLWNPASLELFYRHGDDLMSVTFENQSALDPRAPITLFTGHFDHAPFGGEQANYTVTPDGKRFVFVRRSNLPRPAAIHVVIGWPTALAPAGK